MTHSPPAVCSTSWSPRSWTRAVGFRRRWCELLRQGSCPGGVAGASGGRKGTSGAGSRAVVAAILSPVSSAAGCAVEWPASMGTAEDGGSSGACIGPGLRSASTVGGRGRTGRPARVADRGARRGVAGGDSGRAAEGDRAGTPEGGGPPISSGNGAGSSSTCTTPGGSAPDSSPNRKPTSPCNSGAPKPNWPRPHGGCSNGARSSRPSRKWHGISPISTSRKSGRRPLGRSDGSSPPICSTRSPSPGSPRSEGVRCRRNERDPPGGRPHWRVGVAACRRSVPVADSTGGSADDCLRGLRAGSTVRAPMIGGAAHLKVRVRTRPCGQGERWRSAGGRVWRSW